MRTVWMTLAAGTLAATMLAGCGPAPKDQAMVDDYCVACAEYIGDQRPTTQSPRVSPETQAAMERMEAAGQTRHMADIAATIVRRYRADPQKAFDPTTIDADRQFARWVKSNLGQDNPWGTKATVADVYRWIVANRPKLPNSPLLTEELSKAR